jgi:uncharacterized OB-fold protein
MNTNKRQIPLVEGYFSWPSDDPRLIATRCKSCGYCFFPKVCSCGNPNCENKKPEDILLSKRGKLDSYTIHYYPPPAPYVPPDPFVPFGIGLVEFPEGVRVIGQMTGCDPEKGLKIGMDVETVIEKLQEDKDGNEIMCWRFRPVK